MRGAKMERKLRGLAVLAGEALVVAGRDGGRWGRGASALALKSFFFPSFSACVVTVKYFSGG